MRLQQRHRKYLGNEGAHALVLVEISGPHNLRFRLVFVVDKGIQASAKNIWRQQLRFAFAILSKKKKIYLKSMQIFRVCNTDKKHKIKETIRQ